MEEATEAIANMQGQGVIGPLESPWCSPIVLVRKKDDSMRFCVDYHKHRKDAYLLLRLASTLDSLSSLSLYSTLDFKSGYWQVEMDDQGKDCFLRW